MSRGVDCLILLNRREFSDQISIHAQRVNAGLAQLRHVRMRLEIGIEDVCSIPSGGSKCPIND